MLRAEMTPPHLLRPCLSPNISNDQLKVRCGRNECTEDEFKADVEEIAHVFKELKNVSYIFTPMLALFLGFYMSFAVSRNSEWLNDAIGGVWVGAVNLNMVLATHLRGEEYDLIKKGVLRWTLCSWLCLS